MLVSLGVGNRDETPVRPQHAEGEQRGQHRLLTSLVSERENDWWGLGARSPALPNQLDRGRMFLTRTHPKKEKKKTLPQFIL